MDVSELCTELKAMWDELDNFRPLPQCKCAITCSCGAVQSTCTFRDQDHTIRFLKGLNEQYAHIRSQIIMMDPFPTISKAFSIVIQQERQLNTPLATNLGNDTTLGNTSNGNNSQTNFINTGRYQGRGRGGYNKVGNRTRGIGGRNQEKIVFEIIVAKQITQ